MLKCLKVRKWQLNTDLNLIFLNMFISWLFESCEMKLISISDGLIVIYLSRLINFKSRLPLSIRQKKSIMIRRVSKIVFFPNSREKLHCADHVRDWLRSLYSPDCVKTFSFFKFSVFVAKPFKVFYDGIFLSSVFRGEEETEIHSHLSLVNNSSWVIIVHCIASLSVASIGSESFWIFTN